MSLKIKDRTAEFSSGQEKRFTLRMDSALFETISLMAKAHRRSVAKEIECAISDYVEASLDETLKHLPEDSI